MTIRYPIFYQKYGPRKEKYVVAFNRNIRYGSVLIFYLLFLKKIGITPFSL